MADYIEKIRTSAGDKQINYEALANKPDIDTKSGVRIGKGYGGASSGGVAVSDDATAGINAVSIGKSTSTDEESVAIGLNANAYRADFEAGDIPSVVVGPNTYADQGGVALGDKAATFGGVAIGKGAEANAWNVQIGKGVNDDGETVKFFDHQILDAEGNIPIERMQKAVDYTDEKLGDISTALDELHNYAQALISGGES